MVLPAGPAAPFPPRELPRLARRARLRLRLAVRVRVWERRLHNLAYLIIGMMLTLVIGGQVWHVHGAFFGLATLALNAVVTGLLVWRRRRRPVLVSLVAMLGVFTPGGSLFPLAVFALALRRRDRVLAAVCVAGGAAIAVLSAPGRPTWFAAATSAALEVGLATATGAFLGARRDLMASLRDRAEQAEAQLALRTDQARLAERSRIAQEMHDIVAHRITLVALHAGGLEVRPDAGPAEVERTAALIGATSRQALEDLRGVLGVLRADGTADGAPLAPQPRSVDLPRLVASSAAAGLTARLVWVPADLVGVPDAVGRTVYRVVQEALTNVHKHARGAATTVTVTGRPGAELLVEVANVAPVGRALTEPLPGAGMGLVGLRERVSLAGGQLAAGTWPGGGWLVRASFPWPAGGAVAWVEAGR